jgi:hypothetical protein
MITLKEFFECINYRITEGSDYMWNCYGNDSYQLDSWNGEQPGTIVCVVFDKHTQDVYEMQAWDGPNNNIYRWIHPDYVEAVKGEYTKRGLNFHEASDFESFIDLEVEDDMLEKAKAIANGTEYDRRILVPLTLSDDSLLQLMKMAHEKDMTLNQFVEHILRNKMAELKNKDRDVWP